MMIKKAVLYAVPLRKCRLGGGDEIVNGFAGDVFVVAEVSLGLGDEELAPRLATERFPHALDDVLAFQPLSQQKP